jgi:hypothetical protein
MGGKKFRSERLSDEEVRSKMQAGGKSPLIQIDY